MNAKNIISAILMVLSFTACSSEIEGIDDNMTNTNVSNGTTSISVRMMTEEVSTKGDASSDESAIKNYVIAVFEEESNQRVGYAFGSTTGGYEETPKTVTEIDAKAAVANERACYEQYQMARDGARIQDKESARSLVAAAQGTVNEVEALLQDARLVAPESGQISTIFPKRGELVGAGMPIMNLVVLDDAHVVLNVREDRLPLFKMGGTFLADVPAIAAKDIEFKINYVSPLGSFATWKSTKQTGSYDLRTFEIHALPVKPVDGLRPGMSVLVDLGKQ